MSKRIAWTCEVCSTPIKGKDGYLTIPYAEINAEEKRNREREEARYAAKMRGDILGMNPPINLAELMEHRGPHWRVLHRKCDPDPESGDYWLDVSALRTHAQLLRTTAHLMGKGWILDTDWSQVIYAALSPQTTTKESAS